MRCHYEALGLPRDASAGDVKRAHRRLALLHHPDKNPDCPEDAAEQFKLIQAAYDVLSDPQERAWYDSHREAILRGGQDGEVEDDSHELLQFFTGACYSGFTDSPQGFYAVYRVVFAGIAEQEVEGAPSAEELVFPTFGHSGSDYQTVVHGFYAHWQSFCTHRTLSWAERFDTRHADNRWHKRAMEKENRRARERARRKYSQLVRQLAAFVRRRDPRVQAHRLHLQQVNAQKHQRAQQLQREQAQRQARLAMEYQEQSWVKLSDLERELRQMEAQYQQEFGDGSEETTSGEEDGLGEDGGGEMVQDHDADDHFFCPACDRTFQNVKTMRNHERSRRHRETVALLRQQLEAEERELQEAQSGQELPPSSPRLSKKDRRKKRHTVFTHTPASPTDSDTTDSDSQSEAESGQGLEGGRGGEEGSSGEEGGIVEQEADSQGQERGGREQDESTQERAKSACQGERTEQGEKAEGDGADGMGDRAEVMVEQGEGAEAMVEQEEGSEGKGEQAEAMVEQGEGAEGKGAEVKGEGEEGKGEQGVRVEGMVEQGVEAMVEQAEGKGEQAEGKGERAEEGHHTRSTATPDSVSSPKTKGKKAKQQKKPVKCPENKSQAGLHCVSCEQFFPSRNKLFEHLRATGHAQAKPASTPAPPAAGSRTTRRTIARSRNR